MDNSITDFLKTHSNDQTDFFDVKKEFFLIDSDNLNDVKSHLYGFVIKQEGIIDNDNVTDDLINNLDGRGCYICVSLNGDIITIKQDYNGCYGLYLFRYNDYFAISNSFLRLLEHIQDMYPITLNRDYCNHILTLGLASNSCFETPVNEIKILERNQFFEISVSQKTFVTKRIDYNELAYSLDTEAGIETLDNWFFFWTGFIKKLSEKTEYITTDLSGGYDSRLTFLLMLRSGVDLNKINIRSFTDDLHTHPEDYKIASQIAEHYGYSLNSPLPPSEVVNFSLEDNINIEFYTKMAFHKEAYFSYEKPLNKTYKIGGAGGEAIRDYYRNSADKYLENTARVAYNPERDYPTCLSDEIYNSIKQIMRQSFEYVKNKYSIQDMTSSLCQQLLFWEAWNRFHFGKIAEVSFFKNTIPLQPLIDPEIRKLKLNTVECPDKNLLMAMIYARYCPELLNFPFEGKKFSLSKDTVEFARKLSEKYPIKERSKTDSVTTFKIVTQDKKVKEWLRNGINNERCPYKLPYSYLKALFDDPRVLRIFSRQFDPIIYDYAKRFYLTSKYFPTRHIYSVLAIEKVLESVLGNDIGDGIMVLLRKREIEDKINEFFRKIKDYPFFIDDGSLDIKYIPKTISFDEVSSEYVIKYSDYYIARRKVSDLPLDGLEFPVLLKNCFNKDTITFFMDNLRDSNDCAADNHLYLYYDDVSALLLMICLADISTITEAQKIVFLVGEDNLSKYPLDFKEDYNIDYSQMEPALLRPDECNRMCYFYKGTFSGADFVTHVLARSDDVILVRLHNFHLKTTFLGSKLHTSEAYIELLEDTEKKYKKHEVISFLKEKKEEIFFSWAGDESEVLLFPGPDRFIEQIDKILTEPEVTVVDMFKAYFIAKDYFVNHDNAYNYRLVPCFLYEPHLGNPSVYTKVFESFKYKSQMTAFRDPIKRHASGIRRMDAPPFGTNLPILYSQTTAAPYYSIRFEDLKLYPEATCKAMCKKLNIAFSEKMLSLDYSEKSSFGKTIVKGYDLQPVIRPVDDVLDIFDQLRFRLFFKEITDYYGYPTYFTGSLSDDEAKALFSIPFKNYYLLDEKLSEEEKIKSIERIQYKLVKNYIRKADAKRVRDLDTDLLPEIIESENSKAYRGTVSVNGSSISYDEKTDSLFRLLDGYLLSFAKSNDLTAFKDKTDLEIIQRNIVKLIDLFNEQKMIFGEDKVPVQLLYELTNTNIKLDKYTEKRDIADSGSIEGR